MNRHICLVFRHSCLVLPSTSVSCDKHVCLVLQHSNIVLRHFCFVLHARLFSASALLFNIVLYLHVPIVLLPSHSLLLVYVGKYLYDVYLNNEPYENKSNHLGC